MKCQECVDAGQKSRVTPGMSTVTAMYCAPYYDEEGVYHHHDMNSHTTQYTCSNGHQWIKSWYPACPAPDCDFGKEQ